MRSTQQFKVRMLKPEDLVLLDLLNELDDEFCREEVLALFPSVAHLGVTQAMARMVTSDILSSYVSYQRKGSDVDDWTYSITHVGDWLLANPEERKRYVLEDSDPRPQTP